MPFKKGQIKPAGRKKGTPNKKNTDVAEHIEALDCDPFEGMVLMSQGRTDCTACDAVGKVTLAQFYSLIDQKLPKTMVEDVYSLMFAAESKVSCPLCGGLKTQHVDVKIRADMFKELAQYIAPKRRAIEVSQDKENPLFEKTSEQRYAEFERLAKVAAGRARVSTESDAGGSSTH